MTLEELQEELLKANDKIKALEATNAELTKSKEELTSQNNALVEHNNKLFARLSQPMEDQDKPLTEEEQEDKLIAQIRETMKKLN